MRAFITNHLDFIALGAYLLWLWAVLRYWVRSNKRSLETLRQRRARSPVGTNVDTTC